MIHNPTLPPKPGYVEVEIDGVRQYKPIPSAAAQEPSVDIPDVYAELDAAYQEGVDSV